MAGLKLPLKSGASNDPIGLANNLGATRGATTDGFGSDLFTNPTRKRGKRVSLAYASG